MIADADVAELYGVETKRINEAVKNNPDKFPASYMFVLNKSEVLELRSKISTTNVSAMNRNPTKGFLDVCIADRGVSLLGSYEKLPDKVIKEPSPDLKHRPRIGGEK